MLPAALFIFAVSAAVTSCRGRSTKVVARKSTTTAQRADKRVRPLLANLFIYPTKSHIPNILLRGAFGDISEASRLLPIKSTPVGVAIRAILRTGKWSPPSSSATNTQEKFLSAGGVGKFYATTSHVRAIPMRKMKKKRLRIEILRKSGDGQRDQGTTRSRPFLILVRDSRKRGFSSPGGQPRNL